MTAGSRDCRFFDGRPLLDRQALPVLSANSIAMQRSGSRRFHRTPRRPVPWARRAGKTGIRRSSSSPAGRARDFARAMPTAFCVPSARRFCKSRATKGLSLPSAPDRVPRALLTAHVERMQAKAFNVVAAVSGTDKGAAPVVVMTPRSGVVVVRERARRRLGVLAGDHARDA